MRSDIKESVDILNNEDLQFHVMPFSELTEEDIEACSELYGENYGVYSELATTPGKQIKMSANLYKKFYYAPHYYIATAKYEGKLIGQAIYFRDKIQISQDMDVEKDEKKVMSWIVQLVVAKEYRQLGIASTLLRSIWGFSNDYAWGLATTNPCTVKTLENATFRQCNPKVIAEHLPEINALIDNIPFVNADDIRITESSSQVNSRFYVNNKEYRDEEISNRLGDLPGGYEWLAFVFQSQDINQQNYEKHFEEMVSFSENKLKDAYSRMSMGNHGWTKNQASEIDFILKYGDSNSILDLGCEFECADVRYYCDDKKYDKVLCLFDVVGSFPAKSENKKIIETAYNHLIEGGYLILSVMNMELTSFLVTDGHKVDLKKNPKALAELKPSNTMQRTGDIFNPELLLIDSATSLVYRKEQFIDDSRLPAEYVIRDKRYTKNEICGLIEECGFKIEEARYVSAGHFDRKLEATDPHAKEILIVAKKM